MNGSGIKDVWSMEAWVALEERARSRAMKAGSEDGAWRALNRHARRVMRAYTTSFFIVSRFLPRAKREEVEAVYAAVRYPDEVVDTFPLADDEKLRLLDEWREHYEAGITCDSLNETLLRGVPPSLAGFTHVVRRRRIPAEHYRAFLEAMRRDVAPRPFASLDDLIDSYVYGSAVVVGYFLAHVYGASGGHSFPRALAAARDLGIALQLTNFLRDVAEDQSRGRVYIPLDALRAEGIEALDACDPRQREPLARVLRRLTGVAADYYARAEAALDAFSPDCRLAVHACIKVYGRLGERVAQADAATSRVSVPLKEKFQALPPSKYWRIPLAYLTR
ncbi:MAG TPA: phytoene/squalene synthase family protein [Pyrinomonadaceae bacterium]|jgi:phytoene synthase|nr:phytoene/squalene synthase family protein [Pyrinomonadaceae bacterium]